MYKRVPCTVVAMTAKAVRIQTRGTPEEGPQYTWVPFSLCRDLGSDITAETKAILVKRWFTNRENIP